MKRLCMLQRTDVGWTRRMEKRRLTVSGSFNARTWHAESHSGGKFPPFQQALHRKIQQSRATRPDK